MPGGGLRDGTVPAIGGLPAAVVLKLLQDFRSGRRSELRMQHFSDAEHLPDEAALEVLAGHVAGLRRSTPVDQGSGDDLAAGRSEFARRCAACHGQDGRAGESRGIAALAGQHFSYLQRKLREAAAPGGNLSRSHGVIVSRLSAAQAAAIADWLSRQPLP